MIGLLLSSIASVGFLALLIIAAHRHRRDRQPGALELARVLAVYLVAAVASMVQMLPEPPPPIDQLTLVLMAVTFAVIPLLMVRFADVFAPVPAVLWRGALVVWAPLVVGLVLLVLDVLPARVAEVLLHGFLALWAVGHGVAVIWMVRGGRRVAAVVARRRAQLMALAIGGLGAVLPLSVLLDDVVVDTTSSILVLAVASVALLLLGFAPPAVLRWHWARRDRHELARAQRRMVEIDDPDRLGVELLPHVMRQVGAAGAWLFAGDEVVAVVPRGASPPWRPWGAVGADGGRVVVRHTSHGPVLVAPTVRGHLVLLVDPYALLFGARDLDATAALAVQLDIALDRAGLKARELEAARASEEARRIAEVERIRDDVLATISHELRTPLTTVSGVSSLLVDRWDEMDGDARHRLAARVAANAEQLRASIEQVLELTAHRVAAPTRSSSRTVDVGDLLRTATDDLAETLADHEVLVIVDEEVTAHLDAPVMQQMLRHLLTNAAKFSPSGSPLEVEAEARSAELRIAVSDRGRGMAPEELERAFEPFYRAGNVLHRETRGLGLGLAVVSALAPSVGARLEAHSEPGAGTRVTLVLPDAVAVGPRDADHERQDA